MKTLLSLFDYSGAWSHPFYEGGWNVIQWDIKISEFMDLNLMDSAERALEEFECVDGILAAIPCTDFALSGAQYWKAKDADGRTAEAKKLVNRTLQLIDLFTPTDPDYDGVFFWAIENPVGRLNKLYPDLPQPFYFHPYEFAGHLDLSANDMSRLHAIRSKNGYGLTAQEVEYIWACNAYTKKTGLWGHFNINLEKRPVIPCKGSPQGSPTQRAGGKSDKTKEVRSNTPMGFAYAFYEANKDYRFQHTSEH